MSEEQIFFEAEGLKLEGLLAHLPGDKGVVMTHPHPLYGGEMHNNVVEAVVGAYREKGYSTLRFNFRGVGASQGSYDNGRGEQEDVAAALSYLDALGKKEIDLAGYSFGAWVNALGIERFHLARRLIMVSPPVSFIDFRFLKHSPKIRLVIVGTDDEIAGCEAVEKMLPTWNPEAKLEVIEGGDHFYGRKTGRLEAIISEFLG
ncbi:MAG: alpha/beta hydrolase [Deltaproteobacteria bacterium]|nr:alpha/beta hydrolase [Deltaproteobacteria bacterium]